MLESYYEMLSYRRPGRSDTEERFIDKFLRPLDVEQDEYGNLYKRVGVEDRVMWSSHTDTVHSVEGMQALDIKDGYVALPKETNSNCLGADCTTGVWIMTEMIKAKVPGLYIFHRDEERGAGGSQYLADQREDIIEGVQMAIAFDRYGTNSVITHQMGRCCSDAFADSIIEQIPSFRKDPNGVFTDTAFYTHRIPECTNLSVGYQGHHGRFEIQNTTHMKYLLEKMKVLDISKLDVQRDPKKKESSSYHSYDGLPWDDEIPPWHRDNYVSVGDMMTSGKSYQDLVRANPEAAASLLTLYGITKDEFVEHCFNVKGGV